MWKVKIWFLIRVVIAATFKFPWWYLYMVYETYVSDLAKIAILYFWHFFFNCTFSFSLCGDIKDKVDSFLIAVTLNGRKFDMLMHPDQLENWIDFGHRLLIFLILAAFWLSETG